MVYKKTYGTYFHFDSFTSLKYVTVQSSEESSELNVLQISAGLISAVEKSINSLHI